MGIVDDNAINVKPRMRPEHIHDRVTIEQVQVIKAEEEMRVVRADLIEFRLSSKPFLDVDAVPDEEALVPDGPEAAVPVSRRLTGHRLHAADEDVFGEGAVRHVRLVLGEDMQHALSRHELRRNPAAYRGRLVDHAEDL